MKNKFLVNISWFVVIVLLILTVTALFSSPANEQVETIGVQQLVTQIQNEAVKTVVVKGDTLEVTLNDDTAQVVRKEEGQPVSELLANYGVTAEQLQTFDLEIQDETGLTFWLGLILPSLIPFILIIAFFWFMMRRVQGASNQAMNFGQSQPREATQDPKQRTTFTDVAGATEAKEELKEVVDFLINPKKFLALGAKIPKGVLLMGAPGTGKTLLAKAVAGEAGVPFFSISGSEFVEMFVGVGASRVRDLFKRAKKAAPCIVFIDEIDAVGRQRGAGLGGSHDEREQTLNQILTEMDGFDPSTNVIVMAATNRPDVLDPALRRPGRFDRQVVIDLPDIKDREAILKIHARNKVMEKDVNLKTVAQRTPGFSGADLANVLNEGAILTARRNKKKISQREVLESIEKVMLGPERRSHVLSTTEKEITAYHEAGHALVAHMLEGADPVHKVSIISRGRAAGYTLKLPDEDKKMQNKQEYLDEIAVLLAGRETEQLIFGDVTTGASNDLERATGIARAMVMRWGMSKTLAPRTFGSREDMPFLGRELHEQRNYSEKIAEQIDAEIHDIITGNVTRVAELLKKERAQLDKIARELIEKETIEREEFEALFEPVTE